MFIDSLDINIGVIIIWGLVIVDFEFCCGIVFCEIGGVFRGFVCFVKGKKGVLEVFMFLCNNLLYIEKLFKRGWFLGV